jgi:hypothetical protein
LSQVQEARLLVAAGNGALRDETARVVQLEQGVAAWWRSMRARKKARPRPF